MIPRRPYVRVGCPGAIIDESEIATTSQASLSRCAARKGQIGAADLLLALDQHDQVDRQIAGLLQGLLHAENMRENLALVIAGAARGDDAVLDAGIEWGPMPEIERIDRLHVVVAIDQDGRTSCFPRSTPHDDRMPWRFMSLGSQSDGREFLFQPVGTVEHLLLVFRVGRDASEAKKIDELITFALFSCCIECVNYYLIRNDLIHHKIEVEWKAFLKLKRLVNI